MPPKIAVAAVSETAARAGLRAAAGGGNAVDAALAAGLAAAVTHPGMCSLGGAAFVTVWPAGGDPVVVDGGAETPGRGLEPAERGDGIEVRMAYGGGTGTVVGPGSVAVAGLPAACDVARARFGRLGWKDLLSPTVDAVRGGFPLPPACHAFLVHAWEPIYRRDPRSRAALGDGDGGLIEPGEPVEPPGLADTLERLAREGADHFYRGPLGQRIADHVRGAGGSLTRRDLDAYRAEVRPPLATELDAWRVATNPPPAAGGRILAALLAMSAGRPEGDWDAADVAWLVRAQRAVLEGARDERGGELPEEARAFLEAGPGAPPPASGSGSTLHTSAVDGAGTLCSVTMSDGFGSGVMPPGTGLWLNNCLGERELNPAGPGHAPPGHRLPSNMAPTVARGPDGRALALGTPGSERIPTVLHQVLLTAVRTGRTLEETLARPRLHVELGGDGPVVACEPGLPLDEVELPVRRSDGLDMYFGGAAAAARAADGRLLAAADPRRGGGAVVGPDG